MKFYQVIPAAEGFIYTCKDNWDYDVVAWAFEHGSALPLPVTVNGPQPRKGAVIRQVNRDHSRVPL